MDLLELAVLLIIICSVAVTLVLIFIFIKDRRSLEKNFDPDEIEEEKYLMHPWLALINFFVKFIIASYGFLVLYSNGTVDRLFGSNGFLTIPLFLYFWGAMIQLPISWIAYEYWEIYSLTEIYFRGGFVNWLKIWLGVQFAFIFSSFATIFMFALVYPPLLIFYILMFLFDVVEGEIVKRFAFLSAYQYVTSSLIKKDCVELEDSVAIPKNAINLVKDAISKHFKLENSTVCLPEDWRNWVTRVDAFLEHTVSEGKNVSIKNIVRGPGLSKWQVLVALGRSSSPLTRNFFKTIKS